MSKVLAALIALALLEPQYIVVSRRPATGFVDPTSSREWDALNDWVSLGDNVDMDGYTNGLTMCEWGKIDGAGQSNNSRMWAKDEDSSDNDGFSWLFGGTNGHSDLRVDRATTNWEAVSNTGYFLFTPEWNCYCITISSGGTVTFYRDWTDDGAVDSSIIWPPTANTDTAYIGNGQATSRSRDGKFAYLQIFDNEITSTATLQSICEDPCSVATDLQHAWTLTDNSSTQTDYQGTIDGTTNGTSLVTDDGPPITGMSCS